MRSRLAALAGALAALASVLGLFVPRLYRDDDFVVRDGWIVNDAVTLLVALPTLFVAHRRANRGSTVASLVELGVLHYLVYDYGFYVFGAKLNALLLLYIAIMAVAVWAVILRASSLDLVVVGASFEREPRRLVAGWMFFVATGLTLAWTGQWLVALLRTSPPGRFDASPEFVRLVAGMDLAMMVSFLVPGGVLLWRHRPWGLVLGVAMNVSAALYNVVLAGGTVVQLRAGFAGAVPMLALWAVLGVGSGGAATLLASRSTR